MSSWNLMETTAPQISSPTMNCSPNIASTRFSQHRELRPGKGSISLVQSCKALPFLNRTIHLPPNLFASSSHMGLIPGQKQEWTNKQPRMSYELTHLKEVEIAVAGQFARFHLIVVLIKWKLGVEQELVWRKGNLGKTSNSVELCFLPFQFLFQPWWN